MSLRTRLLQNFPLPYVLAILSTSLSAIGFAWLEYNFIQNEGLPFREATSPTIAFLYPYQLAVFLPLNVLLAFYPAISQALTKTSSFSSLKRPATLGIGILSLSIVFQDSFWFLFRALTPIAADPLAHQWIRPSDYTAGFLGYAQIAGLLIPLWYIVLFPIILAAIVSLLISPPSRS